MAEPAFLVLQADHVLHVTLDRPEKYTAMQRRGVGEAPVMLGDVIHPDDHAELKAMSVADTFNPGSRTLDIIAFVKAAGREAA